MEGEKTANDYSCQILLEDAPLEDVKDKNFPTDAHIVTYVLDGTLRYDLTRGKKINLFNFYWDRFRHDLKSIDFGYGSVNPKLWGYKPPEEKKNRK